MANEPAVLIILLMFVGDFEKLLTNFLLIGIFFYILLVGLLLFGYSSKSLNIRRNISSDTFLTVELKGLLKGFLVLDFDLC